MRSRAEHLAWCKARALEYVAAGDLQGAIASMVSDLGKWEGGQMLDPSTLQLLSTDATLHARKVEQVRHWIEGFC